MLYFPQLHLAFDTISAGACLSLQQTAILLILSAVFFYTAFLALFSLFYSTFPDKALLPGETAVA